MTARAMLKNIWTFWRDKCEKGPAEEEWKKMNLYTYALSVVRGISSEADRLACYDALADMTEGEFKEGNFE